MQKFVMVAKDKRQKAIEKYRNNLKGVEDKNTLVDICVAHLQSILDEDSNRVDVANAYIDKFKETGLLDKLSQKDKDLISDLISDLL